MKVTRILQADCPKPLLEICKATGFLRADVWRRFGALGSMRKNANAIRREISARGYHRNLLVDGTIRAETTKDVVNDILMYKAAAMVKVRQAVAARTIDKAERKRLYTKLLNGAWIDDNFLHRQVRKHFRHGKSHTANQFVVRSDKYLVKKVDGFLVIALRIAKKFGDAIELVTTSNGNKVNLSGSNLRIIVKVDASCGSGYRAEIHYATDKGEGRACGSQTIGVDKGYTEAFVDSDGTCHGKGFGVVLTQYSDAVAATGKQRNRLHALEKKHRAAGHVAKADRIKACNIGRKKLNARREGVQQHLCTIAFKAAHTLVDKAGSIASEDLTSPMASNKQWRIFNRKMSSWAKGTLADALDSVCTQRKASHVLVNCAYTSQIDSVTGLLKGERVADKFYRENGDVLQADHNAALNVLARLGDSEISRFTPYKEVRRILLARSSGATERHGLELGISAVSSRMRQPSADKS